MIKSVLDNRMEVVTEAEQAELIQWGNQNYTTFKKNGPGRQFQGLNDLAGVPPCVWAIKQRIVEREGLQHAPQEPLFKDYMGYITDGGQIHPHTDPNKNGLIHTRFNAIIQLPEQGGMPIYGGITIPVVERTYVRCNSGIDEHYCELVKGAKARIVISYGFLLPRI
jgi:hypothetical protein